MDSDSRPRLELLLSAQSPACSLHRPHPLHRHHPAPLPPQHLSTLRQRFSRSPSPTLVRALRLIPKPDSSSPTSPLAAAGAAWASQPHAGSSMPCKAASKSTANRARALSLSSCCPADARHCAVAMQHHQPLMKLLSSRTTIITTPPVENPCCPHDRIIIIVAVKLSLHDCSCKRQSGASLCCSEHYQHLNQTSGVASGCSRSSSGPAPRSARHADSELLSIPCRSSRRCTARLRHP